MVLELVLKAKDDDVTEHCVKKALVDVFDAVKEPEMTNYNQAFHPREKKVIVTLDIRKRLSKTRFDTADPLILKTRMQLKKSHNDGELLDSSRTSVAQTQTARSLTRAAR